MIVLRKIVTTRFWEGRSRHGCLKWVEWVKNLDPWFIHRYPLIKVNHVSLSMGSLWGVSSTSISASFDRNPNGNPCCIILVGTRNKYIYIYNG